MGPLTQMFQTPRHDPAAYTQQRQPMQRPVGFGMRQGGMEGGMPPIRPLIPHGPGLAELFAGKRPYPAPPAQPVAPVMGSGVMPGVLVPLGVR